VSGRIKSIKLLLIANRDREWQKWPITIVTGAYIGFVVGKLLGGTLLKGKKVMFD
jgi:phosphatidylinositol glycan class F